MMPHSVCTQTQIYLHINLLHKTSDIPETRGPARSTNVGSSYSPFPRYRSAARQKGTESRGDQRSSRSSLMRPSPLCSATQIFKDLLSVPFRAKLSLGFLPRGPLCGAAAIGGFSPRELPRCAGTDRSLHARSLFIATSHPRGPEVTAASRVGAHIKRRQLQPHHCAIHRFRGAVGTPHPSPSSAE
jgi:hypothetical protein